MKYELSIREHNMPAHLDIEADMALQKNGLFTFILRVNNGNIVDYNVVEYANARKYLILKKVIIQEFTVALNRGVGSIPDPVRTDNNKRGVEGRGSANTDNQHSEEPKTEV